MAAARTFQVKAVDRFSERPPQGGLSICVAANVIDPLAAILTEYDAVSIEARSGHAGEAPVQTEPDQVHVGAKTADARATQFDKVVGRLQTRV